ncbi:related to Mitochondrial thiamine pyrophosphate carrier 1 [Cephalotrichum gorgonifer]|uniref:Mitochondrial thiamine pyrophosphate carrier 1 n=1 Tax=Cephalotrichum gorgonifer TaxID=2041049 RepID=A0AAE8MPG2_9PEZI|nr:related to Mitochondrial thiamine pyrophosphate carrier 1 [Cephalotrichum gorgonifer]
MAAHLKDKGSKWQSGVAGATAGLVSRFVIAPLDVVKIRLQLQSHSLSDPLSLTKLPPGTPVYKGLIRTARDIVRGEGITALWKGNVPAELLYMIYSGVQFTTYRTTAEFIRPYFDDSKNPHRVESRVAWIAGTAAGLAGTTVSYPLDLLRTRFAAQGNDKIYKSFFRAFRVIYRDEGLKGFFRGITPTLLNAGPGMGIYFLTYEAVRPPDIRRGEDESRRVIPRLPWGFDKFLAGSASSFIAKSLVFPLDLVRKRMQVQGPTRGRYIHKNIPEYTGTFTAIRSIIATEGARGLYRGLFVTLLKHAPASGVTLWVYESTLRGLMKLEGDHERTL